MIEMQIKPASVTQFKRNMKIKETAVITASRQGLDNLSDEIFNQAKSNAPRVTGATRSSGSQSTQDSYNTLRRTIGFGGGNTNPKTGLATSEYVTYVHELYNPKKPNSYKWLENTVRRYSGVTFSNKMASHISNSLR
ncbi:MAG: hypothetical protein R3Y58_01840 [Eubacteriales bacterium]